MNICFVCCGPLQLLNAINFIEMVLNGKRYDIDAIDIFISNKYKEQFDLNLLSGIRRVYYYKQSLSNSKIKKALRYLFLKRALFRCIENCNIDQLKAYDEIYGTCYDNFFVRLCNINPKAKIIFFDDGIGTYMNDDYQNHLNSDFSNFLKIFNRGVLSIDIKALYCYHPELMCLKKTYPIYQLPHLTNSTTILLENISGFKECDLYDKKRIIYFTSGISWEKNYHFKEEDFIDPLYKHKEQAIIRFHPSSYKKSYTGIDIDNINQVWELQCKNVKENNILIGVFSTAQLSPYLFYGKQYSVIFLYKMVFPKESYLYQQCEKTVDVLIKNFSEIYVPNTINEYQNIVKKLLCK